MFATVRRGETSPLYTKSLVFDVQVQFCSSISFAAQTLKSNILDPSNFKGIVLSLAGCKAI